MFHTIKRKLKGKKPKIPEPIFARPLIPETSKIIQCTDPHLKKQKDEEYRLEDKISNSNSTNESEE